MLETQLNAELTNAGILKPPEQDGGEGYVSQLKLSRPAEYPDSLVVQAGMSVPCGEDVTVSVYRFTSTSRFRVLEAQGRGRLGSYMVGTRFSAPDTSGNRLFYTAWSNVQCASVWNELEYKLYRIEPDADRAVPVFSGSHVYTIETDVNIKLSTEELLLEFTGKAMEGGFRRTYVLHYRIGSDGVHRIDPVALQAQDFVHEWLQQPWSEIQSRSSESVEKW